MSDRPLEIILASRSPRRKELLKKIVPEFRVVPSRVDEERFRGKDPVRFALRAAIAKAKDVGQDYPSSLIIAADTLVWLGEEVLGKPRDRAEGQRMLEKLSGQKHRVITAVAIYRKDEDRLLTGHEVSRVKFRSLSPKEIRDYLEHGDILDKAGSYAVQEVGDAFVELLGGDYDNIVGLPVHRVKKLLDEFLSPETLVEIKDMAFPHDWGVGVADGIVTFVPGAVVGDKVRIRIFGTKRRHRYGRMMSLAEPSPFRVEPECPHFPACGGCAFQHLLYPKQLELKQNYLLQTLKKIGRINPDILNTESIVPSPQIWYYRNKMEYAFGGEAGDITLGLRSRASPLERYEKRTVPLKKCLIFSKTAERIFSAFIDFATASGLPPYCPGAGKGFFRNLVLREGKNTGEVMAVLVTRSGQDLNLGKLAPRLRESVPEVKSLWWVENDRVSDVVDFENKKHVSGGNFIEETLGGLRFRIYPESFFQPNPGAAEILYGRIVREAQALGSRRVLGLYCGPGSIEIFLSRAADEVVGIDAEAMNIRTAEENSRANAVANCRFVEGRVEYVLGRMPRGNFDLFVLDPPRAGLSGRAVKHILARDIPAVIYVSCNPAAFARDLGLFLEKGYGLEKLLSFDFFPHTPHLESLAVLVKRRFAPLDKSVL
jgi:23S rRNA (uracil1939-C5)-methyltransferase